MDKRIGKIQAVSFGMGGYQDAMIGVSFTLGSDKECWGIGDFKGTWSHDPDKHCKWGKNDQDKIFAETVRFVAGLLKDADVQSLDKLNGKPVECVFEQNMLKSWRILTEVI